MKIVYCNGGLGNQLYQFIFARYLEVKLGEEIILDDSFFYLYNEHNGFEIPTVFPNSKVKLLSQCFEKNIWNDMVDDMKNNNKRVLDVLLEKGIHMTVASESKLVQNSKILSDENAGIEFIGLHHDEILDNNGKYPKLENIYYAGYWINFKFTQEIQQLMDKELEFPSIKSKKNIKYLQKITECLAVAVHVRRGDFLNDNIKWGLPAEYYKKVIGETKQELYEMNPNLVPKFFVFSDDISWCKKNKMELGFTGTDQVIFIEGNTGNGMNYVDLQLMSYCRGIIASRSTFCLTAKMLAKGNCFYIDAPDRTEKFDVQ